MKNKVLLQPTNERGETEEADDLGGVFRDVLSAFWLEFFNGLACRESEMIPVIRHDYSGRTGKRFLAQLSKAL